MHVDSLLFVPLGAGTECLGYLVLARLSDTPAWTEMEYDAALDIGRDLGRAIANARQLEQERGLVDGLRELDRYRTELMNTVAHELRNPLASVSGHLELIEEEELTGTCATRSRPRSAVPGGWRVSSRTSSRLPASPTRMLCSTRSRSISAMSSRRSSTSAFTPRAREPITISTVVPAEPSVVAGLPDELHRLLTNLVSNAVKYSDEGSSVASS